MKWTGKTLIYKDRRKLPAEIIAEDSNHILLQFSDGSRIATNKNGYNFDELVENQGRLF
jgi:hypothetical protein